jgi:hypothetical protein
MLETESLTGTELRRKNHLHLEKQLKFFTGFGGDAEHLS